MDTIKKRVESEQAEQSLQKFLQGHVPFPISVRKIKEAIDRGACSVNGKVQRRSSYKVQKGDHILFDLSFLHKKTLRILYEDQWYIACEKPCGLVSNRSQFERQLDKKPLFLCHRLDKETSGVILLAKSSQALKEMEQLFFHRQIEKIYVAKVHGVLQQEKGEINSKMRRIKRIQGGFMWGVTKSEKGITAKTSWQCLKKEKKYSFIFCYPKTGRTHQIRVHLASIHHPIVGDPVYSSFRENISRMMLHSHVLCFIHPFSKKKVSIISPFPKEFHKVKEFDHEKT